MFEREIMIGMLKRTSTDFSKLVEELEEKQNFDVKEAGYVEETLKKTEKAIKRIRSMHEKLAEASQVQNGRFPAKAY